MVHFSKHFSKNSLKINFKKLLSITLKGKFISKFFVKQTRHSFLIVSYNISQIFRKIFHVEKTWSYTNILIYKFGHVVQLVRSLKYTLKSNLNLIHKVISFCQIIESRKCLKLDYYIMSSIRL